MQVKMSVCLCVSPSHFLTPFNVHFAHISQSPMSKLVRFLESFGKSNGKGVKLLPKKVFLGEFCPTSRIFLLSMLLSASVKRFFVSRMRDFSCHKGWTLDRYSPYRPWYTQEVEMCQLSLSDQDHLSSGTKLALAHLFYSHLRANF